MRETITESLLQSFSLYNIDDKGKIEDIVDKLIDDIEINEKMTNEINSYATPARFEYSDENERLKQEIVNLKAEINAPECPYCEGTGTEIVKRNDGSTYTTDCYFCHGKGKK